MELSYPKTLDNNVVRAVASITFLTNVVMLLEPSFRRLVYPLFADFLLRYIQPKLSPLVQLNSFISNRILNKKVKPKYSPPKRFAVLIGVIMTLLMSIAHFLTLELVFIILLSGMLLASGLQSWFDYCVGCKVYDLLVKFDLVQKEYQIEKLSDYLQNVGSNSDHQNPNSKQDQEIITHKTKL